MDDSRYAGRPGDLVARRISAHLARSEDRLRTGEAADLATMEATSSSIALGGPAPTGRWPVRAMRRILYRLLFPMLNEQSTYARTTTRVVTQLAGRVSVLERSTASRPMPGASGRSDDPLSMLALEERFRGSEELITARQSRYVRLFAGHEPVLDIGCGRGEFLALLGEHSIEASGIDLDPDMVSRCRSQGLDVERVDALAHLRSLRPGSQGGIFSAQVIEHMDSDSVIALVSLAADKLRPGGLLLLESVNPLSFDALSNFYVDFTHVRPYDARAVEFLLSSRGFVDVGAEFLVPSEHHERFRVALEAALPSSEESPAVASDVAYKLYGPHTYAVWGYRPPT